MNYAQEIEQIEKNWTFADAEEPEDIFFELLELAKKMQEEIIRTSDACCMAKGILESYKEFKDTEWIPCSERLPEDDGTYLITGKSIYTFKDPRFWTDIAVFEDGDWCDGRNIIAWMPLPGTWNPL